MTENEMLQAIYLDMQDMKTDKKRIILTFDQGYENGYTGYENGYAGYKNGYTGFKKPCIQY